MPNWCENDLVVSGPKKELDRLREFIKGCGKNDEDDERVFDFNKVIPYPKKFSNIDKLSRAQDAKRNKAMEELGYSAPNDMPKKKYDELWEKYPSIPDGYNGGGYNWCCEKWGTKWNASDPEITQNCDTELFIGFETAWSPPIPVIKKLGKLFPKLSFNLKYYEQGVAYKGELDIKKGKVYNDVTSDYTEADFEENEDGEKWGRGG